MFGTQEQAIRRSFDSFFNPYAPSVVILHKTARPK